MNQWQGEPIEDKSILVWSDQGLGDTLMMARYIPMIRARRVIVYTDAAVFTLLRHSLKGTEVLMKGWAFARTDLHVPMMSLMKCFGLKSPADIPQGRYLHPPAKDFDLPAGFKVGVNWQGNKRFVRDFTRSMPFKDFRPLLDETSVFVSLQKGNAQKDIEGLPVIDVMDECHDLCDTASLIDQLDLVISTDTAIPHVAGALGKQTWLLEAYESEWRWGMGDRSPWYESVRVFRQPAPGDWRSVVERAKLQLKFMNIYEDGFRRDGTAGLPNGVQRTQM